MKGKLKGIRETRKRWATTSTTIDSKLFLFLFFKVQRREIPTYRFVLSRVDLSRARVTHALLIHPPFPLHATSPARHRFVLSPQERRTAEIDPPEFVRDCSTIFPPNISSEARPIRDRAWKKVAEVGSGCDISSNGISRVRARRVYDYRASEN